jgi:hypothetical protein
VVAILAIFFDHNSYRVYKVKQSNYSPGQARRALAG